MAVLYHPRSIPPDLQHCQIRDVELTGLVVGKGAHTEVLEVRLPGGICAVKKKHSVNNAEDYHEFKLMSSLRHPHIVQFLGVCELHDSLLPGLVTELMLIDLQSMLLSGSAKVHFSREIKHSILRDVARRLAFLHFQQPPIIHSNLTADNILLNSTVVAKIAGFGSASKMLLHIGSDQYLTYYEEKAERYNEPVDIFYFGILCLFTLIQTYPWPFTMESTEDPWPFTMESTEDDSSFDPDTDEILFSQSREADKQLDVIQRAQAVMGWLVQDIQKCLQKNSELRPTARRMLSVLESEWSETVKKRMELSKPEFVQIMHKTAFQKRLFMVSSPSACMCSKWLLYSTSQKSLIVTILSWYLHVEHEFLLAVFECECSMTWVLTKNLSNGDRCLVAVL